MVAAPSPSPNPRSAGLRRILLRGALALGVAIVACAAAVALWAADEARLTAFARARLNRSLCGTVELRTLSWQPPLGLRIEGLCVRPAPGEPALLCLEHAAVRLRPWPLLSARLAVERAQASGLEVDADTLQAGGTGTALAAALAARSRAAPSPTDDARSPLPSWPPFVLERADIVGAQIAWPLPAGRASLRLARLCLAAEGVPAAGVASASLIADSIDVPAASGKGSVGLGRLAAHVGELRWAEDDDGRRLSVATASLDALASHLALAGEVTSGRGSHVDAALDLSARVEAAAPWPALWPGLAAAWPKAGSAALSARLRVAGDASQPWTMDGQLDASLEGRRLAVAGVPVAEARAAVALVGGRLIASDVRLSSRPDDALRLQGTGRLVPPAAGGWALAEADWGLELAQLRLDRWPAVGRRGPRRAEAWAWLAGRRLAASDTDAAFGLAARAEGVPQLPPAGQPLTLALGGGIERSRVSLTEARLAMGTLGTAVASGTADWADVAADTHGTIEAHVAPVGAWLASNGLPLRGADAHLRLQWHGTRERPEAAGTLVAAGLGWAGTPRPRPLGRLTVPFSLTPNEWQVAGASLSGPDGAARLRARGTLEEGGPLDATLTLAHLPVPLSRGAFGTLSGSALVTGTADAPHASSLLRLRSPNGARGHAVDASVLLEADRLALRIVGLGARIGQRGRAWARASWLTGDELQPQEAARRNALHPTRDGVVNVALQVRALPTRAADAQSQAFGGAGLPLDLDASLHGTPAEHLAGKVALRLPHGWLALEGGVRPEAGRPWSEAAVDGTVRAQLSLLPLARALPPLAPYAPGGTVAMALQFGRTRGGPHVRGTADWRAPALWGQALESGDLSLTASPLANPGIRISARAARAEALDARLDLSLPPEGPARAALDVRSLSAALLLPPLAERHASLTLAGAAEAALPASGLPVGRATLTRAEAGAAGKSLALEAPAEVRFDGGAVRLSPMRWSGSAGHVAAGGRVDEQLLMSAEGRLQVDALLPFVPALRHAEGEVGFELRAHGARRAPVAAGELFVVRPLSLEARGLPSRIVLTGGRVALADERLTLSALAGRLEGGHFTADGQLHLPAFAPAAFDLRLSGSRLPVQAGPVLAESNLNLRLSGNLERGHALVAGDIDVVTGRLLRRFVLQDFNFMAKKPSLEAPLARRMPWLRGVALDLHAKSKGGFDVRIDAGSFAVRSTLESDLHIGGNVLAPKLNGKVSARDGSLRFPKGTLQLRMASIDFEPARRSRKNQTGADVNVVAEGEVTPTHSSQSRTYDITLRLDGSPESLSLDLANGQGLGKMDVLTLLTTGHANVSELAQSGDDSAKLDVAMSVAGSQVAEPMARFAERLLERRLNLQIELGTEVAEGNVRVTAAKNLHRRLRLETAYSHGLTAQQSNVSTRAQLTFTDRLLLEGRAARDLSGSSSAIGSDHALQSNLELKLRLLGP